MGHDRCTRTAVTHPLALYLPIPLVLPGLHLQVGLKVEPAVLGVRDDYRQPLASDQV